VKAANMIPYGRQWVSESDIAAVEAVLRSDFLTQGPCVPRFEDDLRRLVGAKHAVAVNSATSALHIACMALGLGPGDALWTVPITFVASANCGLYCGASVDFVDIDPETLTMCPVALREKLARTARTNGKIPKVIVPVHFAGQSADMRAIHEAAAPYGVRIIEDAAHAVGASRTDGTVGDCRYSDVTVFSFHPVKIVTTGEGGAAVTNDAGLARRMELLRSHGITREPEEMRHASSGAWYYEQVTLGYNYRLTDIAAALGSSQLLRISGFIAMREAIARSYDALCARLGLNRQKQLEGEVSARHLYVVRIDQGRRNRVFDRLRERGIGVNLHYIPVYRQPYYTDMGFEAKAFPASEAYFHEAITLPIHPLLRDEQLAFVQSALEEELTQ